MKQGVVGDLSTEYQCYQLLRYLSATYCRSMTLPVQLSSGEPVSCAQFTETELVKTVYLKIELMKMQSFFSSCRPLHIAERHLFLAHLPFPKYPLYAPSFHYYHHLRASRSRQQRVSYQRTGASSQSCIKPIKMLFLYQFMYYNLLVFR